MLQTPNPGVLAPGEEPSTTSLLRELVAAGYTCNLVVRGGARLSCPACGVEVPASEAQVERFRRFEGNSDPEDMSLVLAIRIPKPDGGACRGTLVLGFGPSASAADNELLAVLPSMSGSTIA